MIENCLTKSEEENHLVLALQKGDRKAFGLLYDKYAPLLLGIITKRVSDYKLAEEILQTLFITIWNQIGTYDGSKQYLYAWMYSILNTLILKNVSSQGKYQQVPQTSKDNSFVYIPKDSIGKCREVDEKAFDLVYFKGYTYAEAASELKITMSALRAKIKIELNGLRGI